MEELALWYSVAVMALEWRVACYPMPDQMTNLTEFLHHCGDQLLQCRLVQIYVGKALIIIKNTHAIFLTCTEHHTQLKEQWNEFPLN